MNDRIKANLEEPHASTTWIQHRATRPRAPYRRFSGDETDGSIVPTYEGQDGWDLSIARRAHLSRRPGGHSRQPGGRGLRGDDSDQHPGAPAALLVGVRILPPGGCIPSRLGVS